VVHHADKKVFAKDEEAIKLQIDSVKIVNKVGIRSYHPSLYPYCP
jgi:hypothetical protein